MPVEALYAHRGRLSPLLHEHFPGRFCGSWHELYLDRTTGSILQGGKGVLVPVQGKSMCDERCGVEQSTGEQIDHPRPGTARGAEDALHAEMAEGEDIGVDGRCSCA